MRKGFFPILLALIFLLPLPAAGQSAVILTSVRVDIRPEYDRDSVLVMYDLELPQSAIGSQMSLRIPASSGVPFALAYGAGDGSLFELQYTHQFSGDWVLVTFSPPMTYLRLEYYDPDLKSDLALRSFEYVWPGDYLAESMTILVMQPWGASDVQISPGRWESRVDSNGLTFFGSEIGQVPEGEQIKLKISYQKSVDDLTTEHLVPQPSGTIPEPTGGDLDWEKIIPWGLGILGAAMLGGGLFWYWKTGRGGQAPSRRQSPPVESLGEIPPIVSETQDYYCHQCGHRASATDRFCRACGARLRMD